MNTHFGAAKRAEAAAEQPSRGATASQAVAAWEREIDDRPSPRLRRARRVYRLYGLTAESSSRNPLEQPWTLTVEEAVRRKEILRFAQNDKRGMDAARRLFTAVRDETAALTAQIAKVEKEIDERVTALYGL